MNAYQINTKTERVDDQQIKRFLEIMGTRKSHLNHTGRDSYRARGSSTQQ